MREFVLHGRRVKGLIKRIQTGQITATTGAGNYDATVLAFDPLNSIVIPLGNQSNYTGSQSMNEAQAYFSFPDTTHVRASLTNRSGTTYVRYLLVEFHPGVLSQFVQMGTITFGISSNTATATVAAVDTTRYILIQIGQSWPGGGASGNGTAPTTCDIDLTAPTTITATRQNNDGINGLTTAYLLIAA